MASKTKQKIATRLSDLGEGRTDVIKVDPRLIVVDEGWNYRNWKLPANREHLKDIRGSIRENGVQNPLWVRFDQDTGVPHLVAGETRLKAVLEILNDPTEDEEAQVRVSEIPVAQKVGSARELFILSLVENSGKSPSQLEFGQACKKLRDNPEDPMTVEQIASVLGHKPRYVRESIELEETASPEIKALITEGAVTPSHAKWTIRGKGDKATAILQADVAAARKRAAAKLAEKEEKRKAKEKTAKKGGKPAKAEKPAKAPKVAPVARPKASNGVYIPKDVLKQVCKALGVSAKSEDPDVQATAEAALESLEAAMKKE